MSHLTERRSLGCTSRPFHLWNPATGKRIPSKYFSDSKRAHWAALREMRWAKVGSTLEVLDVVKGQELGSYTRKVNAIQFLNGAAKRQELSNYARKVNNGAAK